MAWHTFVASVNKSCPSPPVVLSPSHLFSLGLSKIQRPIVGPLSASAQLSSPANGSATDHRPDESRGLFPLAVSMRAQVLTVQDDQTETSMSSMQKLFDERPAGFGVGKVYDTSIEDTIMEEIQHGKDMSSTNILKRGKDANIKKLLKCHSKLNQTVNLPEVKPVGVRVWISKLPKKKNIGCDLWTAFKDVPGLLHIEPLVMGNEKTRDPICKGSGFLIFSDLDFASKFMKQFQGRLLPFGKVEKLPVYKLDNRLDSATMDSTEDISTAIPKLRANYKTRGSRYQNNSSHMEGLILQLADTLTTEIPNEQCTSKADELLDPEIEIYGAHAEQEQGTYVTASDMKDNSVNIANVEKHNSLTGEDPIEHTKYKHTSDDLDCIESERSYLEEPKLWQNIRGAWNHKKDDPFVASGEFYSKRKTRDEIQESASTSALIGQINMSEIEENISYNDVIDSRVENLELAVGELQLQLGSSVLPQPSTGDSVIARSQNVSNFQPHSSKAIADQLLESNTGSCTSNTIEDRIQKLEMAVQKLQLQLQSSLLSKKAEPKPLSLEAERRELKETKNKVLKRPILKKLRSVKNAKPKLNQNQRMHTKSKQKLGSASRLKRKERKLITDVLSKYGK